MFDEDCMYVIHSMLQQTIKGGHNKSLLEKLGVIFTVVTGYSYLH